LIRKLDDWDGQDRINAVEALGKLGK